MKTKTLLWIGATVAAVAGVLAWAFAPRPLEVELAQAARMRFERTIDEDAKTRLRDRYVVSAPVAGRLARTTLREGDAIDAGAPLAVLAPAPPTLHDERTLREQQARVETARSLVQRAEVRVERAQVAVEQAAADVRRSEQLAPGGFVAPTRLETDRLALRAAQKEVDSATQDRRVALRELEQARAAVDAVASPAPGARAVVVRAPAAGRVLRVLQSSEGLVAAGTPLVELGDTSRLEVVAELLTADALAAQPGTPVRIERWGGDGVLDGRVRAVEPGAFTKVSALGVEEQRVRVLVELTSAPERWRALGDGFRVGVRLVVLAVDDALVVPASAVFPLVDAEHDGFGVFAFDGKRARIVPVELGARNGAQAWLRSGIDAGTRVVVYPPAALTDGARVKERSFRR